MSLAFLYSILVIAFVGSTFASLIVPSSVIVPFTCVPAVSESASVGAESVMLSSCSSTITVATLIDLVFPMPAQSFASRETETVPLAPAKNLSFFTVAVQVHSLSLSSVFTIVSVPLSFVDVPSAASFFKTISFVPCLRVML